MHHTPVKKRQKPWVWGKPKPWAKYSAPTHQRMSLQSKKARTRRRNIVPQYPPSPAIIAQATTTIVDRNIQPLRSMKRNPSEKATYDYGKVFVLKKLLVSSQVEPDPKCEKFICSVNETDNEYKVYQKAKETERKTLYQQPE